MGFDTIEINLVFAPVWKAGYIALSGVEKNFCTISGSRDIRKSNIGYRILKELDIGQSRVLNSHVPYYFAFFGLHYVVQK